MALAFVSVGASRILDHCPIPMILCVVPGCSSPTTMMMWTRRSYSCARTRQICRSCECPPPGDEMLHHFILHPVASWCSWSPIYWNRRRFSLRLCSMCKDWTSRLKSDQHGRTCIFWSMADAIHDPWERRYCWTRNTSCIVFCYFDNTFLRQLSRMLRRSATSPHEVARTCRIDGHKLAINVWVRFYLMIFPSPLHGVVGLLPRKGSAGGAQYKVLRRCRNPSIHLDPINSNNHVMSKPISRYKTLGGKSRCETCLLRLRRGAMKEDGDDGLVTEHGTPKLTDTLFDGISATNDSGLLNVEFSTAREAGRQVPGSCE